MREPSLVAALASLAEVAAGDVGGDELLRRLVDAVATHLDVDGAGVMACDAGSLRLVHVSHSGIEDAESVQDLAQEGPCHDAATFRTAVVVDDLTDPVQTAWPEYVARALQAGFRSVVAVPLVIGDRVWGSLDLYRRRESAWQPEELALIRVLAHVATSYLVISADRDAARRAQRELAHASTHDALTGLANRVLLFDRLQHALDAARRHRTVVAVLFIDLNRFKAINDTFGHAAGDLVLTTIAERMSTTLRQEDTLARLSGDEFVLLCENLPQGDAGELEHHVGTVVSRLRRSLTEPLRIGSVDLVVTASIGVAYSDDGSSAEELLAEADGAMYRVKHGTGGASAELAARNGSRDDGEAPRVRPSARQLRRDLTDALPQGRLRVHYQPIADAHGVVHAVEALLRWAHPVLGLLPAAEFVRLAEAGGQIVRIGHWVIGEVCAQMGRWHADLGDRAPETAYVNLSPRELADPDLSVTIVTALDENALEPARLGLELLEHSFLDPAVVTGLTEQQRRGHPLSVDDFGTGYSSLSRLVELPARLAKIDKSFVAGIPDDPRRRSLVEAVVTVAAGLGLDVVAEGVESAAEARTVLDAGCHLLQGYHCGRPQPAEALTGILAGTLTGSRPGGWAG
ncbi:putative bifunctional diguanylate cyclase/phosphodiesterase [Kineococcus sp. SYSU DK003]|uniref:putative bifunctional diguanylate cyclase/phosphodiesterase n=1 Tax=Kineococcus sp. SYSU DK003 TaxID=3383124 RepID=UPI003D7CA807